MNFSYKLSNEILNQYNQFNKEKINNAFKEFIEDNNMNEWFYLDKLVNDIQLEKLREKATQIKNNSQILIIVATGGSLLGIKGIIETLKPYLKNQEIETIYLGDSLSSEYLKEILQYIKNKDFTINIISKSGTTLEPNIVFNEILNLMKEKYSNEEISNRVVVTTTKDNELYNNALKHNYFINEVSKNIGGRFSTLSQTSYLPLLVNNINILELIDGAKTCYEHKKYIDYIIIRDIMFKNKKNIEFINLYEPKLYSLGESFQQVLAETQSKNNKGILPFINMNPTNLHSLGQLLQDGCNNIFETNIIFNDKESYKINKYNKSLEQINHYIIDSIMMSHLENDISSLKIEMESLDEFNLGYLIFFYQISSAIGAYLLNVPYHNQDGVEKYKKILIEKLSQ